MIIGEGEKIRSIPFKHILIFVSLVVCAGLIFRFGFMKIFHNMNKNNIRTPLTVIDNVQESKPLPEELESENNNLLFSPLYQMEKKSTFPKQILIKRIFALPPDFTLGKKYFWVFLYNAQ